MFTRFSDFDSSFAFMDEFRRRMDRLMEEMDGRGAPVETAWAGPSWPRMSLHDEGQSYLVYAHVPGLSEKDFTVMLNQDVLTISAERKTSVPSGYSVHRQERPPVKFSRSVTLPAKVDPEKVTASIKDGVLQVSLPKAPESQPRQITVRAQ